MLPVTLFFRHMRSDALSRGRHVAGSRAAARSRKRRRLSPSAHAALRAAR